MKIKWMFSSTVLTLVLLFTVVPVLALDYDLGDNALTVHGYVSQGVQASIADHASKKHDIEEGVNQAITTVFGEVGYEITSDLKFYGAGKLTYDWIYEIKDSDDSWEKKMFDESDDLEFDDHWWQLLHEAHLSWSVGDFQFRVGKQIVSWGEMDFLQIMDMLNPVDTRRGFADVEFEETIIPVNMLRAEWWPEVSDRGWFVDELSVEIIYIPNGNFIGNQGPTLGNETGGIWSADFVDPSGEIRYGAFDELIREPDAWEGEFGLRARFLCGSETVFTLNGFYGRSNSPVEMMDLNRLTDIPGLGWFPAQPITMLDSNGIPVLNLNMTGYYPRQRFVGITLTTELSKLRFVALGGAAPVLRAEVKYEFDKEFSERNFTPLETDSGFIESDQLECAVGLDWKFKINWLNKRNAIDSSFQLFVDKITDYPNAPLEVLDHPDDTQYWASAYIQTLYLNSKLVPSVAFLQDFNNRACMMIAGLSYSPTSNWNVSLTGAYFNGNDHGQSAHTFRHKDYVAAKIRYSF